MPHWSDVPFIVIVAIGVLLPEIYLRLRWSLHTLMIVRLSTLILCCILATIVDALIYPGMDAGLIFTRAFIYIGVCRMIVLSSHQISEQQIKKRP